MATCFEIYKNLGEDRIFSNPTMGLINNSAREEHSKAVNLAMEALVDELEVFAESQRLARAAELEECLAILNCSNAIHYTTDSSDEDTQSGTLRQLTHWINRADGEPSEQVIENVFSGSTPYKRLNFWKLVNQLLLRGFFEQAIGALKRSLLLDYLKQECDVSFGVVTDAISLLEQYPYSMGESFREWKAVTLKLSQFYEGSVTSLDSELRDLIADMVLVMSGSQSKIVQYSKTWYESFCGLTLFYIPTLELSEEYLEISMKAHPLNVCNTWEQASLCKYH